MRNQYYSTNNLSHYGVKGMRWGVRRNNDITSSSKTLRKRLTVKDNGLLTISNKPASRKGKINFAVRGLLSVATLAATIYVATHPEQVSRGEKAVKKMFTATISTIKPKAKVDSGIFSKELGRILSVSEAFELGLDLRG